MTYHSLIPDDGHPLFSPIGSFRDQGKVVLPDGFLSSVEGAVGTASNLEVSAENDNDRYLRYFTATGSLLKVNQPFACWQQQLLFLSPACVTMKHMLYEHKISTHQDSSELRKSGVVGSGLSGGEVTKAAALAQFLLQ